MKLWARRQPPQQRLWAWICQGCLTGTHHMLYCGCWNINREEAGRKMLHSTSTYCVWIVDEHLSIMSKSNFIAGLCELVQQQKLKNKNASEMQVITLNYSELIRVSSVVNLQTDSLPSIFLSFLLTLCFWSNLIDSGSLYYLKFSSFWKLLERIASSVKKVTIGSCSALSPLCNFNLP